MNDKNMTGPNLTIIDNIAVLSLGSIEEKSIILTKDRIDEIERLIGNLKDSLKNKATITGLVIKSPSTGSFCYGADINAIKDVTDKKEGSLLAARGQEVFKEIENLAIPVIAAIHGHCVGGGCELALACDYRIITDSPSSKIGLPETKLGILPGFGGTQRMPKTIGLPKSLDIILAGKIISARQALSVGLVDKVIKVESSSTDDIDSKMMDSVTEFIKKGKKRSFSINFTDSFLTFTKLGRLICEKSARKGALKKTKGHYPAIELAIDSCFNAFRYSEKEAYEKEADYLGSLIITPESKSLVHIFFLTESASKLGKGDIGSPLSSLSVIGAGVMGKGIASIGLKSGLSLQIFDPSEDARNSLMNHVKNFLEKSRSVSTEIYQKLIKKINLNDSLDKLPDTDLFIEAVVENLEVKRSIFSEISNKYSESILASNTSSLSLKDIFKETSNPERCIGIHFFNPVEKMPLVELVRTTETSDKTLIRSANFVTKLGKYPVVVEDVPGFLVNRILTPYLAEASNLLKEGASFLEIESTMTKFGFPMGPFRLIDEVGLDIAIKVEEILTKAYGARMSGSDYLSHLIKKELFGKKSGIGFYIHEGKKATTNTAILEELNINTSQKSKITAQEIEDRLILSMLNESLKAFEEGVAGTPSKEAKDQIDLASIMGIGFPPFRGGLLYYAEKQGLSNLGNKLNNYKEKGERFNPANIFEKGQLY